MGSASLLWVVSVVMEIQHVCLTLKTYWLYVILSVWHTGKRHSQRKKISKNRVHITEVHTIDILAKRTLLSYQGQFSLLVFFWSNAQRCRRHLFPPDYSWIGFVLSQTDSHLRLQHHWLHTKHPPEGLYSQAMSVFAQS